MFCTMAHLRFLLLFLFCCPGFLASAQHEGKFAPHVLEHPEDHPEVFETKIGLKEITQYHPLPVQGKRVVLENGYAEYRIKNPGEWPPQDGRSEAFEINLIFTKYPRDKTYWLTNYHWLLAKRLQALFKLDSNLNSPSVSFNIIYQTDCATEMEAQQLFHGIEINYRPIAMPVTQEKQRTGQSRPQVSNATVKKIQRFVAANKASSDSTVFRTLERNAQWNNAVLVVDWTGSMYGYGSEAVLWNAMHEGKGRIGHFVFFNDGDRAKDSKKIVGFTGGIYHEDASSASRVVRLFSKVKSRGNGGDSPENDLEAVVAAIHAYPDAGEIVLVADNNSCMRDFPLVARIDRPVHIILCGSRKALNPQYVNLAWLTGGTVHTYGEDIDVRRHLLENDMMLRGIRYTIIPGMQIEPVDPSSNPFKHCNRYNTLSAKQQRERIRKDPKCGL